MTPQEIFATVGHEWAFVRIVKAPAGCQCWLGKTGPLRHKMSSEPMIADGMLVFGAIEDPGGSRGAAFFAVAPEGLDWDFEIAE